MSTRARIILFFLLPLVPLGGFFKLHGVVEDPPRPVLTPAKVARGEWQDAVEKNFARHFGAYAPLVRLDNTLNYQLGETNLNGNQCVIIGKRGILLPPDEVQMREQEKFDDAKIRANIAELGRAVHNLEDRGIRTVVVYVPNKLETYPNSIAERWSLKTDEPRPYVAALESALADIHSQKIPLIDGREILAEVASATGAPGYPRRGRHWTDLVSCEVLGRILGFNCGPTALGDASNDEQDLLTCLNAFFPFTRRERVFRAATPKVDARARALFVGTSFMRELETEAHRLGLFNDLHLFYYNKTDFVGLAGHDIELNEEWKRFILSRQLIVLDFFAPQIEDMDHGFAKQINSLLAN